MPEYIMNKGTERLTEYEASVHSLFVTL